MISIPLMLAPAGKGRTVLHFFLFLSIFSDRVNVTLMATRSNQCLLVGVEATAVASAEVAAEAAGAVETVGVVGAVEKVGEVEAVETAEAVGAVEAVEE